MKRNFSRYAINVYQLSLDEWPYDIHTHNFYELILINEGCGVHMLNKVSFEYRAKDVFLLTPEDAHEFRIKKHTVFTYIKFTEQIFLEKQFTQPASWNKTVKDMLFNPNTYPESIVSNEYDRDLLFHLSGGLLEEFRRGGSYSRQLILELFGAVMVIVIRNLDRKNIGSIQKQNSEKERVSEMLSYIRQHIGEKELLSQKNIAEKFLLSPNYISMFLKKNTGMTLQTMVTETRLVTAERLLKQSDLTITQIAGRLGFNDASHMNKAFKKYRGKNPVEYRRTRSES